MENNKKAFPVLDAKYGYDGENLGLECSDNGMTLRDWFAGQALAGYSVYFSESGVIVPETAAEWCYKMADAMLAARERTEGELNNAAE